MTEQAIPATTPTTEDRIWSVLSHLSALAFGMGIVLPIVGWADQRRKSNYSAFQNLQALGYQSLGFTIWILSYLVIIVVAAIIGLITGQPERGDSGQLVMIVFYAIMLGFLALYFLLPIIAAVACALGKDFRYPWMGKRLARYLAYDPAQNSEQPVWLDGDHELRWVTACGHFSVLIMLWGMLAPLTAWVLYGKRSLFMRFQSIQTLVYQAGVTVLYFIGGALYMVGLLVLVLSLASNSPSPQIIPIVIAIVLLLPGSLVLLVIPLFHILGQWAGYRVLKGDNYHYPLVGRLVDKWMSKPSRSS